MARALYAALIVLVLVVCGCGGGTTSHPAVLTAIAVSPSSVTIVPGTTTAFKATGSYSDGTVVDLTALVTWSSSNPAAGTVSNAAGSQGVATAVAPGSTTITATTAGISGSATLTAALPLAIAVTPPSPLLIAGTTQQLTATATLPGGGTQDVTNFVTWTSSNNASATVSATGLVTALGAGAVTISATSGNVTGSTPLTVATLVSLRLTSASTSVNVGSTLQLAAIGTLSNGVTDRNVTTLVTWSSANTAFATVNPSGTVTALAPGSAAISAAFPGIATQTTTITVLAPTSMALTPANPTLVLGSPQQLKAVGVFADGSSRDLTSLATWSSSDKTIANVSDAVSKGLVTPVANGSATITAAVGSASASTTVAVKSLLTLVITPPNPSVALGSSVNLTARATFSDQSTADLSNSVTWTSSAPAIASVSPSGLVSANVLGSATITAKLGSAQTATTVVQVIPAGVVVNPANRAYVSNFGRNTVSVVETLTNTVIKDVAVGAGPEGIAVNTTNNMAYVANSNGATVSVIYMVSNAVVATINVGGGPWDVAVNPAAKRVYVTNSLSNSVSVIDATSNAVLKTVPVGSNPKGVAINTATNRLYVANFGSNTITVIDTASNSVLDTILVGAGPIDVAVNAAANLVYVANNFSQVVTVIDVADDRDKIVSDIAVGSGAQVITVTPANTAYVSVGTLSNVSVINTTTNTLLATIPVGPRPVGVAVKQSANRLYVVNNGSNDVWVFDTSTNALVATITGFSAPTYIAVIP